MMKNNHILHYQARVEQQLIRVLPSDSIPPIRLHQAMSYAVLNGGKRIRPLLVYATGLMLGAELEQLDMTAAALEMIHCYSLIHDDLPAMDNDDLRRGKPTCHKAFDEATAILAGDALQAHAFELLSGDSLLTEQQRVMLMKLFAHACGSFGMAGGQAIDLDAVGHQLTIAELEQMHRLKTGMLIRASVLMGAIIGNADEETLGLLTQFAEDIGLAFQIQDDILDVEGETTLMGKQQGADEMRAKPTYPALLGLAVAKEKMKLVYERALFSLEQCSGDTALLADIAQYIVLRDR